MIKNDSQRERTSVQLEGFRDARARARAAMTGRRAAAVCASYEGMIRQFEEEIREYDKLKRGKLDLPSLDRLEDVAPLITRIRISRNMSQTELAKRLGVSKQVISRLEESDYQTAGMARLQEILDALGVRTSVTMIP